MSELREYSFSSLLFIFISPIGSINLWRKSNTKQKKQNKQEAQLMLTNPHDAFRGQARSPNSQTRYHSLFMYGFLLVSYSTVISHTVFEILDFSKYSAIEQSVLLQYLNCNFFCLSSSLSPESQTVHCTRIAYGMLQIASVVFSVSLSWLAVRVFRFP